MSKKTIYVVDDDPKIGDLFATVLRRDGYDASSFVSPVAMLEALDADAAPDLILTDLMMPDMSGIELLEALRERGLTLPVIVMTAHSSVQTAVEAMRLGAFHYLQKPVNLEEMRALLAQSARPLLRQAGAAGRSRRAQEEDHDVGKIVGTSPEVENVRDTIETLKRHPEHDRAHPGRDGDGQEPRRPDDPLPVATGRAGGSWRSTAPRSRTTCSSPNCSATRRAPSPTPAPPSPAFWKSADGGTLFLDEIDSMSACRSRPSSSRSSRAATFRRLGGTDDISVTTRIVCATNANLEERVAEKEFRKDLFFRINVVSLRAPGAAADGARRAADREGGGRRLLQQRARSATSSASRPRPRQKLLEHDWPGNVRELRNVLERALIFTQAATRSTPATSSSSRPRASATTTPTATSASAAAARSKNSSTSTSATSSPTTDTSYAEVASCSASRRRRSGRSARSTTSTKNSKMPEVRVWTCGSVGVWM